MFKIIRVQILSPNMRSHECSRHSPHFQSHAEYRCSETTTNHPQNRVPVSWQHRKRSRQPPAHMPQMSLAQRIHPIGSPTLRSQESNWTARRTPLLLTSRTQWMSRFRCTTDPGMGGIAQKSSQTECTDSGTTRVLLPSFSHSGKCHRTYPRMNRHNLGSMSRNG